MFDIDIKRDKNGYTALYCAVYSNNPMIVELLLKEYHANPNVVNNENKTILMHWGLKHKNLSILALLVKYGFDFARLVNQRSKKNNGKTVFHILCDGGNTDHNISCFKLLFSICEKIPNCAINILAQDYDGKCGLHYAIEKTDIDMTKYLLENVYFPNNDKLNEDGITFISMPTIGSMRISLAAFVVSMLLIQQHRNVNRDLEMLKLLVSYGMKFNSEDKIILRDIVRVNYTELVAFILDQNFCLIDTLGEIVDFMYKINGELLGSINHEILKALYNYGLEHRLIWNKSDHSHIIREAAKSCLATFKTTMIMILERHGINDLKQYRQCDNIDEITLETIAQSPNTKPNVKSFIEALMCGDETKLLKLDVATATSKEVVITCNNDHELKTHNENKIINYSESCSVCDDSGDDSKSLFGFQCDECKSFICNDCIIVQKIRQKMDENRNALSVLIEVTNEIFEYKNNKKLFNKVELIKFLITFCTAFGFFCWFLVFLCVPF